MAGVFRRSALPSAKPAPESAPDRDGPRSTPWVKPFRAGTDPTLVWLGPVHREILDRLRSGVMAREGVLLLTGDIGTGKTILATALLHRLRADTLVATVTYGRHDPLGISREIAAAWDLGDPGSTRETFHRRLSAFLDEQTARDRRALLVVDEAQGLTQEVLTEIGQLAILTSEPSGGRARLSILLVGQNELEAILSRPENAALAARVGARCASGPLVGDEVREYVAHQLKTSQADSLAFTDKGLAEIAAVTHGIPRLINTIGNLALRTAAQRGLPLIDGAMVRQCAQDLGYLPHVAAGTHSRRPARLRHLGRSRRSGFRRRIALYAPAVVLLAVGVGFLYQSVRQRDEVRPEASLATAQSTLPPAQSAPPPAAGRPAIEASPEPVGSIGVRDTPAPPLPRVPSAADVPALPAVERPPIGPAPPGPTDLPSPAPPRVPTTRPAAEDGAAVALISPPPRPQPSPSALPGARPRRAAAEEADPIDPAGIIDWLLSEYPARRQ